MVELPESVYREHEQVTSSLYQPKNPLEMKSRSAEIEEKLKRIKSKLVKVEGIEKKRAADHMRKQWEQYEMKRVAFISEFKRPITTAILLASAVCVSCHALWWLLEREKRVEELQVEQTGLIAQLEDTFKQQQIQVQQQKSKRPFWFSFY